MPGFTKSEKVLNTPEFADIYKRGKKVFSKNFFCVWVAGERKKIGLTVSSKVGNAVTRNRIKRVLREFFRLNKTNFPAGSIVITARTGADALSNGEIRDEVAGLLKKY